MKNNYLFSTFINQATTMDHSDKSILYLQIIETRTFKCLIEILAEIKNYYTVTFYGSHERNFGIQISDYINNNTSIGLVLFSDAFPKFKCEKTKLMLDIDMKLLDTCLKLMDPDNIIVMYINKDDANTLIIKNFHQTIGSEKKVVAKLPVNIRRYLRVPIIPIAHFNSRKSIDIKKFYLMCRNLIKISDIMRISCHGGVTNFNVHDDKKTINITYGDSNILHNNADEHNNVYNLQNFIKFDQCHRMCQKMEIYAKDDFPLLQVIYVGSLGKLYVFHSSNFVKEKTIFDNINHRNLNYSDIFIN